MNLFHPTPRQAAYELIFAGALWGFGFVAAQWALSTWSPTGLLLWRFLLAFVFGEILFHLSQRQEKKTPSWRQDLKGSLPAGAFLGSFLLLQTIGLQYTSASKSGFITTLYVVFVPIANGLFFNKKFPLLGWVLVLLACLGTLLLMGLTPNSFPLEINIGDLWTLASALIGTAHIIYIGRYSAKVENAFRFNNFQSLWALVVILSLGLFTPELQRGPLTALALAGVLILAVACSVLAFYIQVRAQKVLSDTTASMLFLLESPYAFFFAVLLLGDRLSGPQFLGALLILGAALGMVVLESGSTNKAPAK